jgi:FlaA1/EpsC-like NDP-sugar epimerase
MGMNHSSEAIQTQAQPRTMHRALIEHRFVWLAGWDSLSWVAAICLATWMRYEFDLPSDAAAGVWKAVPVVIAVQLVAGFWQGLYRGRWHLGSFEEIAALIKAVVLSALVLFVIDLPLRWVPISVPVAAVFIALVNMAALRYAWRIVIERRKRPSEEGSARVLVFGAGDAAQQVITAMLRDPDSPYLPVAIVDDDPRKAQLRIRGVQVCGTRADIPAVAAAQHAEMLLIATPSADGALVRELAEIGDDAGLRVMAVPAVADLFDDRVGLADIRPLTTADLLGRREIDTDVAGIAGYLAGRRVLVTGAGGSIGSELCRQVHAFGPAELVMLDRDESALHAVQLAIEGRALLETRNLVVADIRDRDRLAEVFEEHRPDVVFHAAALKHLPLCEMHPSEAVKTNVWGTAHLLGLALEHHVSRFVNISTDKAADPVSVLGTTKRIAERLTAHASRCNDGTYMSVRFGNVLGSRGSVLGAFQAQIEMGGPITVTHPDVTRYFMTVEEAVQLVIQAGAIGERGEAMVLDMGEPVRIADVAKRLADQADRPIEIVYTGLRPGEKLHEVLQGGDEVPRSSTHPLIARVEVDPLDWDHVTGLCSNHPETLRRELDEHAGTPSSRITVSD